MKRLSEKPAARLLPEMSVCTSGSAGIGRVEERHIDSSRLSSVMLILFLYYENNIHQQLSITNPGKTEEEQILCHK